MASAATECNVSKRAHEKVRDEAETNIVERVAVRLNTRKPSEK